MHPPQYITANILPGISATRSHTMNTIERDSAEKNINGDEREDDGKQGLEATERDIHNNTNDPEQVNWNPKSVFNSRKALWAFLVLCYSV